MNASSRRNSEVQRRSSQCYELSRRSSQVPTWPRRESWIGAGHGQICAYEIKSEILNNTRKVAAYLPPDYHDDPQTSYPIMIMNDGHNLFWPEDSYCGVTWRANEALDDVYANQDLHLRKYIVLGVYPIDRDVEYLPKSYKARGMGGGAELYLDFLEKELLPHALKQFRALPGPVAIIGSSFGGIISMHAWLTRPAVFNICGAFSPSAEWNNSALFKEVNASLKERPDAGHKLYMDGGTDNDELPWIKKVMNLVKRKNVLSENQFKTVIAEGHNHSEGCWAERLPEALRFLLSVEDH